MSRTQIYRRTSVLIGRIAAGTATDADRREFEELQARLFFDMVRKPCPAPTAS